jgi:hypothetical protein
MKEQQNKGVVNEYPIEVIKKYKATSTRWKLEWLEEVNRLTNLTLTKKQKKFREKIREGLL